MKKIHCLNPIAACGTDLFPADYEMTDNKAEADAFLVRSASMHEMELPEGLLAVGRAGAGVNNIPLDECAKAGVVVFNTPGANANGVKELVLAGMFLASRDIVGGIKWCQDNAEDENIAKTTEKSKKAFAGWELKGKKLGVIGLGAIGAEVANAATHLGMEVYGYDPYISVNAAWRLSRNVKHITNVDTIFQECDYITVHVPLLESTKGMINKEKLDMMKDGVVILNFARDTLVNDDDMAAALEAGKVARYVSDFPNPKVVHMKHVILTPHLGASTRESEDNCAVMAVQEITDYLENGNIKNSVNYPACDMGVCQAASRIAVLHMNIPNMIGQITAILAAQGVNISDMTNKSRDKYAYTLLDLEHKPEEVAALPYDVYNRKEACAAVAGNPISFLNIDRAETQFSDDVDTYADCVYEKARELLDTQIAEGVYVTDAGDHYYLYELTMDGRSQTGIVACSSIDDYVNGVVKKHENTREDKEIDRIRHVDTVNAQTGPIFLAYRQNETLKAIVAEEKAKPALYDFVSDDGIRHRVWKINDPAQTEAIEAAFAAIPATYIADGHHRAASAVKVGLKRRAENPGYTGEEPFNYFLSVLFPDEELMILPYNRVVKDLNGLSREQFFEAVKEKFELEEIGKEPYAPAEKGTFGMYLDNTWYALKVLPQYKSADPVKGLDVSILQDQLLGPVLGIGDPRTDKRIDFIGGIRGLKELERRVSEDMEIAFSMYPTSIEELLAVADAGLLMPPKSTWFEPKLRSGLFIHRLS